MATLKEVPPTPSPSLNSKQQAVLRWVAEGSPVGVFEGDGHKISARSLHTRGLVRIRGKGPNWRAEVTDQGRDLLQRLDQPSPPRPKAPTHDRSHGAGVQDQSKTQQLVDDLVAAVGLLRLPLRFGDDGPTVRQRAYAAQDAGKLPDGKVIETRTTGNEIELRLVDGQRAPRPPAVPTDLPTVPFPDGVAELHHLAVQWLKRTDRHEVSEALLPRAQRIISAIASEARRRRWKVVAPPGRQHPRIRDSWSPNRDGHLQVTVKGIVLLLRLKEEGVRLRGKWEDDVKYAENSRLWDVGHRRRERPSGLYDANAKGRLTLQLRDGGAPTWSDRPSNFNDRRKTLIEERLPELFHEMARRADDAIAAAKAKEIAAQRAAEAAIEARKERERRWPLLMAEARERFLQERMAEQLRKEASAWHEARRIAAYCDALEAAQPDEKTRTWIQWARAHIGEIDPTREPKGLPLVPEPQANELCRFLPPGWSPYGPG